MARARRRRPRPTGRRGRRPGGLPIGLMRVVPLPRSGWRCGGVGVAGGGGGGAVVGGVGWWGVGPVVGGWGGGGGWARGLGLGWGLGLVGVVAGVRGGESVAVGGQVSGGVSWSVAGLES